MEEVHSLQDSETASVVKVAREPSIVINGVPDLPPDCASGSQAEVSNAADPQVDPRFGEWLEGRKVKKLFGDEYYGGEVVNYDSQSNWYNVVYEDGDQEDLEWPELEEILLPLDITIPLKTLVMDKCKLQNTPSDFRPKASKQRKVYTIKEGNTNKMSDIVPISQGSDTTSNPVLIGGVNGEQSNNMLKLLPAPTSNDAKSGQSLTSTARENAIVCVMASNQPRKRGRPRKDGSTSVDSQPKRRGRPPKNRSISGNAHSAESTPSSVATNNQEASRRQNSVLQRNAQTSKAEKLKRENMRVQGASPGTQLF